MSGKASVTAYLGMDISSFQSGLDKANSSTQAFKKQLDRKVGVGDAFKGLFAGIGISVDSIAEKFARLFTGVTEDSGKAFERIVAAGDKATAAFKTRLGNRRSVEENLKFLDKEDGHLRGEVGGMKEQTYAQRVAAQLPVVGEFNKNSQEAEGIFSTEQIIAKKAEVEAELQINDLLRQELQVKKRGLDFAREGAQFDAKLHNKPVEVQAKFMARRAADLLERSKDRNLTGDEREALKTAAENLEIARQEKLNDLVDTRRVTGEKLADFQKEAAIMEETTAEKILRLRKEILLENKRALDGGRSEAERAEHQMKWAQKTAEASKLESDYRNKPLTVAQAAANTGTGRRNTTAVGTAARHIQEYSAKAERFRAQGNYRGAEHYDTLARNATDAFETSDRAGRLGAQEAARNAAQDTSLYGKPYKRADSFTQAVSVNKSADAVLKSAAADFSKAVDKFATATTTVELDD